MVRNYIRKTDRQNWSLAAMESAVEAVISEKITIKRAHELFSVPYSTLDRYVRNKRLNASFKITKTKGKFKPVFNAEQEAEIASYLFEMQNHLFGITMKELRHLAYQLAERDNCKHDFRKDMEMAGEEWAKNFASRHPELDFKKSKATLGDVSQFFRLLTELTDEYFLDPSRIYSCDQTTINPETFSRTNSETPSTSAEAVNTITVEVCSSANGDYMPPLLIFPSENKREEYETGLPKGGWAEVEEVGCMTAEIFYKWFLKFIKFSEATKDNPAMLLIEEHTSHAKDLQVMESARDNGVVLLCFPPDCSHLQPLDVFTYSLSVHLEEEANEWLEMDAENKIGLKEISALFGRAFLCSADPDTAVDGFEETGVWPVNPEVFAGSPRV